MNLTFAPRGILQIDDARIVYRNFSGAPSKFNREGDRNFAIVIPDEELAQQLINDGWNVKIKPPREEGDTPFITLPVKVKFSERCPVIRLKSGNSINVLDEESVCMLDHIDLQSVDVDIRPYDWEVNGKTGRTAYLQSAFFIQEIDRFYERYMSEVEE